jgi:hypothetical protein
MDLFQKVVLGMLTLNILLLSVVLYYLVKSKEGYSTVGLPPGSTISGTATDWTPRIINDDPIKLPKPNIVEEPSNQPSTIPVTLPSKPPKCPPCRCPVARCPVARCPVVRCPPCERRFVKK